jgi:hypothetical protein
VHEALAKAKFERDVGALNDAAAARIGLQVNSRTFPILDLTIMRASQPLRLRILADNWDELPPAITLLKADGQPWTDSFPPSTIFNNGPHDATKLPFICMAGSREFHTHSGHRTEVWDNFRGKDGMSLLGIAMQIANAWRTAKP